MKKGQVYEGFVERVDFPNKGIVQTGEGAVIVKNSLPGQKVKISVSKVRKGKAEGRLLEVTEKSPLETGSPCSHFGLCGGCTYLSLSYEEQLKIKERQVKRLLDSVLDRQESRWVWEGIKGSPAVYEYRNKMEFTFGDEVKEGPLSLGMHKRGSFYDIVTTGECRIVDEDYRLILKTVRDYFAGKEIRYFHRQRHQGYLRHLLVRKASRTGEILAALVTTSQNPWGETVGPIAEEDLLQGFLKSLLSLQQEGRLAGRFAGILHIVNDSQADVVQSDHTEVLYGQEYFYEELLGLRFKISTFSFFQTNSRGAELLYETAREYIEGLECRSEEPGGREERPEEGSEGSECRSKGTKSEEASTSGGIAESAVQRGIVFDLYSGTGTIAQLMAPVSRKVIGVEIVEEAVEAARRNAEENGLNNCEFIAGDVLKVLDSIREKPDLIILDPPRDGIHPKTLPKIIDYGVDHIVYISCKPTSLARDLEAFLDNGYAVERAVAVDQFPWTANIESIVLLSKLKSDKYINVELEMDELDLTAAESKATYEEIKDYVLKQSGLKVSNLYIAQVKQKCGIIERTNYNLPKSDNSRQPKCPPEKEAVIREALKHFRMI
jgi:tRNA/tmRNA/rRNA uracil-C5-methylase (TrmA/RlmC/RlmD family)